jgi:hypothetical protein
MLRTELKSSDFSSFEFPDNYLAQVIESMRERVSSLMEAPDKKSYFFQLPCRLRQATLKKRWRRRFSFVTIQTPG